MVLGISKRRLISSEKYFISWSEPAKGRESVIFAIISWVLLPYSNV